jgi:hypothetical protein
VASVYTNCETAIRLTRKGKKQLDFELESWQRLSTAVGLVLAQAPEASA